MVLLTRNLLIKKEEKKKGVMKLKIAREKKCLTVTIFNIFIILKNLEI